MTVKAAPPVSGLLGQLPCRPMNGLLFRCISQLDFMSGDPPQSLLTSRRPGRCNPRGVECLYLGESEAVAELEYRGRWKGTGEYYKPMLTFTARVALSCVLDLEDAQVRDALGLDDETVFGTWRGSKGLTPVQGLGLAVSRQARLSAIRFPSVAMRREGGSGWNVVIFKASVRPPDSVAIIGESDNAIETWP